MIMKLSLYYHSIPLDYHPIPLDHDFPEDRDYCVHLLSSSDGHMLCISQMSKTFIEFVKSSIIENNNK